jgi:hypothetical protein
MHSLSFIKDTAKGWQLVWLTGSGGLQHDLTVKISHSRWYRRSMIAQVHHDQELFVAIDPAIGKDLVVINDLWHVSAGH